MFTASSSPSRLFKVPIERRIRQRLRFYEEFVVKYGSLRDRIILRQSGKRSKVFRRHFRAKFLAYNIGLKKGGEQENE